MAFSELLSSVIFAFYVNFNILSNKRMFFWLSFWDKPVVSSSFIDVCILWTPVLPPNSLSAESIFNIQLMDWWSSQALTVSHFPFSIACGFTAPPPWMLLYPLFSFAGDDCTGTPRSPRSSSKYHVLPQSRLLSADGEQLKKEKMYLWKDCQSDFQWTFGFWANGQSFCGGNDG